MEFRDQILALLERQKSAEERARDLYLGFVNQVEDGGMRKDILAIIGDEASHVVVVESMINTVRRHGKAAAPAGRAGASGVPADVIRDCNAILLVTPVDRYVGDIIGSVKNAGRKLVYVSYNKLPLHTKKVLQDHGIGLGGVFFIDCVEAKAGDDVAVSPTDLTGLSILVSQVVGGLGSPLVVVDTLSGFSTYHSVNVISRFVASMNDAARGKGYVILWVGIDGPEEEELNTKVSQLCDETVRPRA